MKLIIAVEQPNITLYLKHQDQVVDSLVWEDTNSLSTTLLANIDQLLKKNGLTVRQLADVSVETSQAAYTSARIARAVAKTLKFCLEQADQ